MNSKLMRASKEAESKSSSKSSPKSLRSLVPRGSLMEERDLISIPLSRFNYRIPRRLGVLDRRATTVKKLAWMTANQVHKRARKTRIVEVRALN